MATKHIEYSMTIYVFNDTKCLFMLCDKDNNWVLLLLTSFSSLTLVVDLVGGMGTSEANPSQVNYISHLSLTCL